MSGSNRGEKPNLGRIAAGIFLGSLAVAAYWWMFYDMGASYTRYGFDRDQNNQSYAADTAQKIQNDCVGLTGSVHKKCLEESIKANAEYQQSENDLEAQRSMSKWAFWLLVITSGQLFATIIGLVYLKGTLDATREAVEDTGKATKAMVRQNELTEEGMRPWIYVQGTSMDSIRVRSVNPDQSPKAFDFYLNLRVRNVGSRAAKINLTEDALRIKNADSTAFEYGYGLDDNFIYLAPGVDDVFKISIENVTLDLEFEIMLPYEWNAGNGIAGYGFVIWMVKQSVDFPNGVLMIDENDPAFVTVTKSTLVE